MSNWSAGYVADIAYTFGYYHELNPNRIKLAFLSNGLAFPDIGSACELGFGQGLSTNIHAAASVTQWYGTDFSPAQASFAQELARAAGTDARLFDDSFADFVTREDLPDFDYIGLHGIWSWVSDTNRALIVDFIKRKLKVGGVVYISYNTLPGWSAFAPIRHLMTEHTEIMGSQGSGIVSRIEGAIGFAEKLLATDPKFARAHPHVSERVKALTDQDRHYLAHEYFNKDWHPMYFSTMADWLEPAKLQYACSAHYLDHIDTVNLTPDQQTFLNSIPDSMLRQSVFDFLTYQQFRRDYWVKGARQLSPFEKFEKTRAIRVLLVTARDKVTLKVSGALGEAEMSARIYDPILDFLADHKPKTIGEIAEHVLPQDINGQQVLEVIMVLTGVGYIGLLQDDQTIAKAKKHTDLLNKHLVTKSRDSAEFRYLASPVTGGGIAVAQFHQYFLAAIYNGLKTDQEWVHFAYNILEKLNQKLVKNGETLESKEENLAQLQVLATEFKERDLPLLKVLKIV